MASSSDNFKQFSNPLFDKLLSQDPNVVAKELIQQFQDNRGEAFPYLRKFMFKYPVIWEALLQTTAKMKADENINFLNETYLIRTSGSTIENLYNKFISKSAPHQINIDSDDVKLFEKGMKNQDQQMINQAIEKMNKYVAGLVLDNIAYKVKSFYEIFPAALETARKGESVKLTNK